MTSKTLTRKASTPVTTVTFGAPMTDLPQRRDGGRTTPPAAHWEAVAATARQHEGQWIPVTIPGKSPSFYAQSASSIRNSGKRATKALHSFRSGGYDAEVIDGQLYVRYAPQPTLTAVPRTA